MISPFWNSAYEIVTVFINGKFRKVYKHQWRIIERLNLPFKFHFKKRNMTVHHLDGNKLNNEYDNLLFISLDDHIKLHSSSTSEEERNVIISKWKEYMVELEAKGKERIDTIHAVLVN